MNIIINEKIKNMNNDLKLTIVLIVLCTLFVSGTYIIYTWNDDIPHEPNEITGTIITKLQINLIFTLTTLFSFTIFFGLSYMAIYFLD